MAKVEVSTADQQRRAPTTPTGWPRYTGAPIPEPRRKRRLPFFVEF